MDSIEEASQKYFQEILDDEIEELKNNEETIQRFKQVCLDKGLNLTDDNFRYIYTIGIVATYPDLLTYIAPTLICDKEGLIRSDIVKQEFGKKKFVGGLYYNQDYLVMAHPFFRRGFCETANYAPHFIDLFWGLEKDGLDLFIALDLNRVRVNVDETFYAERDTWYGAKFSKEISQIPDGLSKLRPPLDLENCHISFFFKDAYSLDTQWDSKDSIRTFQAEEFKTEKVNMIIDGFVYHPVRYIHAEYDIVNGYFRHFDGAVHLYSESEYFQRRDSDFNYNSKFAHQIKSNSKKLFKMNGIVDVDTFILYSSHFFSGNPLILEYFEGKYPEHIINVIDKLRNNR